MSQDTICIAAQRSSPRRDSESPSFHTACGSDASLASEPSPATSTDSADVSRLSRELDAVAAGPLHSTMRDDHAHAPPALSATALLENLSLETIQPLSDVSLMTSPRTNYYQVDLTNRKHSSSKNVPDANSFSSRSQTPLKNLQSIRKSTTECANTNNMRAKLRSQAKCPQAATSCRGGVVYAAQRSSPAKPTFYSADLYTDDDSTMMLEEPPRTRDRYRRSHGDCG